MTGESSLYIYTDSNAPKKKINYSYSKYGGEVFLLDYVNSRNKVIQEVDSAEFVLSEAQYNSSIVFQSWIEEGADITSLDLLIKRFEVTRKVYSAYNNEFRPIDKNTSFVDFECYVFLAYLLITAYKRSPRLQYVNALLKLDDIVLSNWRKLDENEKKSFAYCLREEMEIIEALRASLR